MIVNLKNANLVLITENEYYCDLDRFLLNLSCLMHKRVQNRLWLTGKSNVPDKTLWLFWLYTYALNNYDFADCDNYLTPEQVQAVFAGIPTIR